MRRKENNRTNEHLNCATQTNYLFFTNRDTVITIEIIKMITQHVTIYYTTYTSVISSPSQSHTNSVSISHFKRNIFGIDHFGFCERKNKDGISPVQSKHKSQTQPTIASTFSNVRIHLSEIQKLKEKKNELLYNFPSVGIINVHTHVLRSHFTNYSEVSHSSPYVHPHTHSHTHTYHHIRQKFSSL